MGFVPRLHRRRRRHHPAAATTAAAAARTSAVTPPHRRCPAQRSKRVQIPAADPVQLGSLPYASYGARLPAAVHPRAGLTCACYSCFRV